MEAIGEVISGPFSIATNGDIRYAADDDVVHDIEDFRAALSGHVDFNFEFPRLTLRPPFNIDADLGRHLKGGTITQDEPGGGRRVFRLAKETRKEKPEPIEEDTPPPPIHMTMVESSNVSAVGYDEGRKILRVMFGERVYDYANVPPEVHKALMAADSIGSFVARQIKPEFECTPVTA